MDWEGEVYYEHFSSSMTCRLSCEEDRYSMMFCLISGEKQLQRFSKNPNMYIVSLISMI